MSGSVRSGYKQTKAGVIPEDWEVVRLKELLSKDIQNGYSPICPEETTGHWILSLGSLSRDRKLNIFDRKPAPINDLKVKQFVLKKNDFLISRANTPERVGFSGVFRSNENIYSYPDLMMRFRINEKLINIDFLENYLKSFRVINYLQISAVGSSSSMVKINKKIVENILILLPPLKEQEKIAKILTTWDRAIEKLEELITQKEQLKKGLMQKLLSDEVRFKEFKNEWKEIRLGDIVKIRKGEQINKSKLTKDGDFPVINGGITPSGYTNNFNTLENTITISEGGNSCGFVNYITERFWSGGHCYTLEEIQTNKIFLYQVLKLNEHRIMKLRVGSGLPNIQKKDIENFKFLIPSFEKEEEQQKIAQVLTTADKEIELLKKELKALKEQKRGLMQKLLTGEVRVIV